MEGQADGIMVTSLNSHVVDCSSSPGPGGLNSHQACVHAQDPERRKEEKGLWCGHPPWGDFSLSVSLSLSVFLASARALQQKPLKKKSVVDFPNDDFSLSISLSLSVFLASAHTL